MVIEGILPQADDPRVLTPGDNILTVRNPVYYLRQPNGLIRILSSTTGPEIEVNFQLTETRTNNFVLQQQFEDFTYYVSRHDLTETTS